MGDIIDPNEPPYRPRPETATAAGSAITEAAQQHTLPLLCVRDKTPIDVASAILLGIGEDRFIVTAAHVLEEANEKGAGLFVASRQGHAHIGRVTGFSTDPPSSDVVVVHVRDELQDAIAAAGYVPLNRSVIDPGFEQEGWPPAQPRHLLCPYGFPKQTWDPKTRTMTWQRRSQVLAPTSGEGVCDFDQRLHVVVEYPSDERESVWMDGKLEKNIAPSGFSGGGVWSLPLAKWENWNASDARLVAVETFWVGHPVNKLRCTRIDAVFRTLRVLFPHVVPSLDLLLADYRWKK